MGQANQTRSPPHHQEREADMDQDKPTATRPIEIAKGSIPRGSLNIPMPAGAKPPPPPPAPVVKAGAGPRE